MLVEQAAELIQGDPIIRRARMGFRGEHYRKELAVVIEMLRELGALRDLNDLPEGAGANAVIRRVISDLGRVASPHAPFPDIPGWRRITDVKDLWATGKQMLICLRPGYHGGGDYVVSHIMGRSVFLSHTSHSALVQFRQLPGGVWAVEQCSGRSNEPVSAQLQRELYSAVRSADIKLLDSSFGSALDAILQRSLDRRYPLEYDPEPMDAAA